MSDRSALAEQLFMDYFGRRPSVVARAPGRVNIIGEHTDYNDGFVMPIATDLATWTAAAPRDDGVVRVYSETMGEEANFELDALEAGGGWADYLKGVAWALADEGIRLRGMDAVITSSVPPGSGISSSAALEVSWAMAMMEVVGERMDPNELALACQKAENEFVGMKCGVMDQLASVLGREDHAVLIDCRSLEHRLVPVPGERVSVVVMDTGVPRALVDSEYNIRRQQCERAAKAIGVRALRDAMMEDLEAARDKLDEETFRRARHVIAENARVHEAAEAFAAGDFVRVGELINASHFSLRDDYEVSCPELDLICEIARAQDGCFGARLVGAGFGGCAMALVRSDAVEEFCGAVKSEYDENSGRTSTIFAVKASDGAKAMRLEQ